MPEKSKTYDQRKSRAQSRDEKSAPRVISAPLAGRWCKYRETILKILKTINDNEEYA